MTERGINESRAGDGETVLATMADMVTRSPEPHRCPLAATCGNTSSRAIIKQAAALQSINVVKTTIN